MPIQGYPDPGNGLRLHLNENTGGCSPRVLEAIRRVQTSDVATYPSYPVLVHACAAHFGVDPDWVLLTNGLDEGILMAAVGHIARTRAHDAETIVPLPISTMSGPRSPLSFSTAATGSVFTIRVFCQLNVSTVRENTTLSSSFICFASSGIWWRQVSWLCG